MLKTFFIFLAAILILDSLWLKVIAKNFFTKHLGPLLKTNINLTTALITYLVMAGSFAFFISTTNFNPIATGAILGATMYLVYELTNLATLKNWPVQIVILDVAWGTFLGTMLGIIYTFAI